MGKVIALEHPELACVQVDLDPSDPKKQGEYALLGMGERATLLQQDAQLLFNEVWSDSEIPEAYDDGLYHALRVREEQIAFRHGIRYVARLRKSPLVAASAFLLTISARGSLENLRLEATRRQKPAAGEVEIRVQATGLNFIDVLDALDLLPPISHHGGECAGEVVAIGDSGCGFAIGDAVVALVFGSSSYVSHASYVTVKAEFVIAYPEGLTPHQAATIPVNFLTAYYALRPSLAPRPPCPPNSGGGRGMAAGDRVLIHAAAGGTGMAAVQLAQLAGAEVFATASPTKWEALQKMGVKHIYNSRTLDFADEVMADTNGQGVDIVLNSLSGEGFIAKSLSVLAPAGRFVEIGKRNIWEAAQVAEFSDNISYYLVDLLQLCQEEPTRIQTMLRELMPHFAPTPKATLPAEGHDKALRPLPRKVFPITDAVSAFRYMQQAKHIGKIVLAFDEAYHALRVQPFPVSNRQDQPKVPLHPQGMIKEDSTYLITGGLGGLGLLVAQWMVERGARHLVLIGRREPKDAVRSQLKELEKHAKVRVAQADVSQIEQLARVLADIDPSYPLKGIIHAAGVLSDGTLRKQNWASFAKVFAPKVQGAWNLHQLTKEMGFLHPSPLLVRGAGGEGLDFFVLFSSAASLLGSAGQANHAAANAFLDALAHSRRAQGLPAMAINWGAWDKVGAAAQREAGKQLLKRGLGSIAPQQGLEILEQLMIQKPVQIGVVPINWSQFRANTPFLADFNAFVRSPPVSSHTRRGVGGEGSSPALPSALLVRGAGGEGPSPTLIEQLETASPDERRTLLRRHVCATIRKILLTDRAIPPESGFFELGMDSLTSIELRNELVDSLGCELSSTLTFDYPTVNALVDYLDSQLPKGPRGHVGAYPCGRPSGRPSDEQDAPKAIIAAGHDQEKKFPDLPTASNNRPYAAALQLAEQLGLDWDGFDE
jgi:myxalamid-type polyketide synthase MxaB